MARLGIVLAAGASERLPNKLLLPIRGHPLVVDACLFCFKQGCAQTKIIVPPQSLVETYLTATLTGDHPFQFVEQQKPTGIMDALRLVDFGAYDEVLITFGDNVYPDRWSVVPGRASIGETAQPNASQLDGWYGGWMDRIQCPGQKLAGWVCVYSTEFKKMLEHSDFLTALSMAHVLPHLVSLEGWWDLGTPEAYRAYWSK